MSKKTATLCLGLLLAGTLLALEPPERGEMERYRADGTLPRRQLAARLLGNHRLSPRLVDRLRAGWGGRISAASGLDLAGRNAPPSAWSYRALPARGTVRVLALLVAFAGTPPVNSAELIHAKLFGAGVAGEAPYESLRNFYRRSSYGQLEIQGDTLGWYTTPYPREAVAKTTAGREALILEALHHYQAGGHDFRPYDNDGDGYVDYLIVIWSGEHEGWADFWWGYQTSFSSQADAAFSGKRLYTYSWMWESSRPAQRAPFHAGTVVHETGHALGLPDYYDYDEDVGPDGGVGGLDMMDASRGDHNGFSKFMLDWIQPAVVSAGSRDLRLRPSSGGPDAALLMPGAGGGPFGEFFLIENRDRSGNDAALSGSGLLIWHVDSRLYSFTWQGQSYDDFLYDNSYTDHKLLRLMEADGQENIETGTGNADSGDYYTSGMTFSAVSRPSSDSYDFQPRSNSQATTVAVDRLAGSGGDLVCRASAQHVMSVSLEARRGVQRSWLNLKAYAALSLRLRPDDAGYPLAATTLAVYRLDPGRFAMTLVAQEPGSSLADGGLTLYDRALDLQGEYEYQVLVLDGGGAIVGVSSRVRL